MLVYQDGELVEVADDSVDSNVYGYGDGYTSTSTGADNIDVGGGWNPATLSGDTATADAAAATGLTDSSWYNTGTWDPSTWQVSDFAKSLMTKLVNGAKSAFTNADGSPNIAALATAAAGLYSQFASGNGDTGGYNKPVPQMEAFRQQVQYDDPNRRPGEAGRRYSTDQQYFAKGDADAKAAAVQAAASQAAGLAAAAPKATARENPWAGKMNLEALKPREREAAQAAAAAAAASLPQIPEAQGFDEPTPEGNAMAHGGIAALAKGGRYLSGKTDGMADEIPTSIDGKDPAALSHGEFVIPADVVSHLGNGNSDAGAQKLYDMMARIRKARTGTEKQGKQINPDKYMPGGLAKAYAAGGTVQKFVEGGTTTPTTTTNTTGTTGGVPLDTSKTSTLSPWVGDYVTQSLGEAGALAAQPYQSYTGPLTAGPSNLQQQAFAGASELAQTGYTPTQYTTGTFDTAAVQQYMNPYLSAALQPQLDEARRQAQISRMEDASRLTKAGAYGGGRQAIMESELNRNLMEKQNQLLSQGYATAFDKAMGQFNTEQGRQLDVQKADEASRQFGANFATTGLKSLADLGAQQRAIEQEGVAADQAQFEAERDWAYKMPQYKLNLLQGLPIGAQTSTTDQTGLAKLQTDIAGLTALYKSLENLGQTSKT